MRNRPDNAPENDFQKRDKRLIDFYDAKAADTTLLNLYLKVCEAVAYAHSRNVLHLDIKPSNIHIGKFGEVFLCDWGLARILVDRAITTPLPPLGELDSDLLNDMTLSGTIKGTPGFMAPEQAEANSEKTMQTDIYALGALLYNLLTYELPVKGDSKYELLENTRKGNIIPLHTRRKHKIIPRSLSAVTMKALSLDPANRYAHVNELRQEISRYLAGFPTTAERAGPISRVSFLVKRHNRMAALALFFLLVIATIISINLMVIRQREAMAVAAHLRAEENLRLYRQQQQEALQLTTELSELTRFALKTRDYSRARQKIRVLGIALQKTTNSNERKELLLQKGTMHFVLEEFNQAIACFQECGGGTPNDDDTWQLSRMYVHIKPNDDTLLTLDQLARLVEQSKYGNKAIYYLYFHHMNRAGSVDREAYLPLATAMLNKLNRIRNDSGKGALRLYKRPEGWHLDLTHSPYITYTLNSIGRQWKNILEPLRPYSMDISGLPLRNLSELENIPVTELIMSGVRIDREYSIPVQLERMGVRTVILDIQSYSPNLVHLLRQKHKVIDTAMNTNNMYQAILPL
jgi:hypothetical protein